MIGRAPTAVALWLCVFLVALTVQRLGELVISKRHEARLRAMGAVEHSPGHFPLLVAVHVLFPIALACEVLLLGTRPGRTWPLWLGLWLVAQAVRVASIRTLGQRWSVRIWVVPGMPPVRDGLYRWMRHPNYVAVVVELITAPLMFGAWRTAMAISALNLLALGLRVRAEDRALATG